MVVNFIPRLVSLGRLRDTGAPAGTSANAGAESAQDFLAFCSPESIQLIFDKLLAPCSVLSLSVMKCIQKYFCWLGIHQGYLELAHKPPSSCSSARNYFTILRPLEEHSEWQVFLAITMTASEVRGGSFAELHRLFYFQTVNRLHLYDVYVTTQCNTTPLSRRTLWRERL